MDKLKQSLVEESGHPEDGACKPVVTLKRRWQVVRIAMGGAFCGLLMAAGCTLYHYRQQRSTLGLAPLQFPGGKFELYSGDLPDTETQGDDRHWLQCILNTGGTCNIFGCDSERGNTNCEWFDLGYKCMCQPGFCSNLAGRCEESPNQVTAASAIFENAQWPGWFLAVGDHSWTMWVQQEVNMNSKWNLLQTPQGDLMLGSVKFPSYVATTVSSQACSQCTDNDGNTYDCNCYDSYDAQVQQVKKQDMSNFIRFEKANWPGAYKIYSASQPLMYWYASKFGSTVKANWGEPGPQGWWIMKSASSRAVVEPPA